MKILRVGLSTAFALAWLVPAAAPALAAPPHRLVAPKRADLARPLPPGVVIHDRVVNRRLALSTAAAPPNYWGGVWTTSTGEQVTIYVSNWYANDATNAQTVLGIANFMSGLVHGSELPTVTVIIDPLAAMQAVCSVDADACYSPTNQVLEITGDPLPDGTPLAEVVTHEYGHHIANNRLNPPWQAEDWGPKNWASVENVCSRTQDGTAFPGDEGDHYGLNPGEAWAESYRVLNQVRAGGVATWPILDPSFFPSQAALAAADRDVTAPWSANRKSAAHGRFKKKGKPTRLFRLATPRDGGGTVSVTSPAGPYTVAVVDPETGKVVFAGRRVSFTLCGARSVELRVRRHGRAGAFTLRVSLP